MKEEIRPISQKLSGNTKEGTTSQLTLYKAIIILIPKPVKDITIKENYKPKALINLDVNILNKTLANRNQQYIKRKSNMTKWGLFHIYKAGLTFKNQLMNI